MTAGVRPGKDRRLEQEKATKHGHITLSESQRFRKRNIFSLLKGKVTSQGPETWGPYQVMDSMGYILINVMDGRWIKQGSKAQDTWQWEWTIIFHDSFIHLCCPWPSWFKKPTCSNSGQVVPALPVGPNQSPLPLMNASAHKAVPTSWCSSWKFSHKAPVSVPDLDHAWENVRSKEWKCSFLVLQSGREAIKIWINLSEMKMQM